MVTDDGVLLHVEVDGRADAPVTVVFVHGFCSSIPEYGWQRDTLRANARLVLFDQRGHGRSGWGRVRDASLERLGRDLGSVLDQYGGAGPVVVVGHSMGAMAVLALAQQRPETFGRRVAAAALLSATATGVVPPVLRPFPKLLTGSSLMRAVGWALWLTAPVTDRVHLFRTRIGRRVLRHYLFGAEPPTGETLTRVQQMWSSTPQDMAAAFYPGMLSQDASDAVAVLGHIPCLVLTGADDRTITARHSRDLATAMGSSARLAEVAGAGHMVNMTHPREVAQALRILIDHAVASSDLQR